MAGKKVTKLKGSGKITYYSEFLKENEAKKLFDSLMKDVPWEHGIYSMYGKDIKTPRKLYAMRDKGSDITKSYKVTGSMEWTPSMKKLKNKVEKLTGTHILYAQLNLYRDGSDYIGWHTDSEVQKGDFIASLSLGAERKFSLRHITYKDDDGIKDKYNFDLENGSLLIMDDDAAKYKWKHTIPKMKDVGPRINITFRPR